MAMISRSSVLVRALNGTALTSSSQGTGLGQQILHGALIAALALTPVGAAAQQAAVTIDPSQTGAGAPRRDMAPNGTPVVKIATPSASGVSHNKYTDFNVDARGLILNNSDAIVSTQLAGYIDGNGNLKSSGPAKIILNEVTGPNRSMLGGYMEIAGAPAELVLANPYGITCSGCGFINASDVTLVAGRAMMDSSGGIAGYRVSPDNGTLAITGAGLDASGARLALFARAIDVNAGVWADRIETAFGAGDIAVNGGEIVVTAQSPAQPSAPAVALDVAALGGMYARSIRLVGTEAGLGVNVDGTLASLEQGVELAADGRVTIGGRITSAGDVDIQAADALVVPGTVFADGTANIAATSVENAGLIASTGDLAVTTGALNGTGTIAAGLKRDGTLGTSGDLTLSSTGALTLSGRGVAADTLRLDSGSAAIDGSLQGRNVALTSTGALSISATGDVRASEALAVSTERLTQAGILVGDNVTLDASVLANSGIIAATDRLAITAGTVTVDGGTMQSDGAFGLAADSLAVSDGSLVSLGTEGMALDVDGALTVADGEIGANGALAIAAGSLDVAGAASRITGGTGLTLELDGGFAMTGGEIASGGDANIAAAAVDIASGDVRAAGALALTAPALTLGSDALAAGNALDIAGGSLANAGTLAALGDTGRLGLALTDTLVNDGLVQAQWHRAHHRRRHHHKPRRCRSCRNRCGATIGDRHRQRWPHCRKRNASCRCRYACQWRIAAVAGRAGGVGIDIAGQ